MGDDAVPIPLELRLMNMRSKRQTGTKREASHFATRDMVLCVYCNGPPNSLVDTTVRKKAGVSAPKERSGVQVPAST